MSWNYRVVRSENGLCIHDADKPIATNECPTYVHGVTIEDLKQQLTLMLEALHKPILDQSEIVGSSAPGAGH